MYIDKGDLSQAEAFFQEIINSDKSCIEAYMGLAQVYRQRGIKEKAQAVLEQAVKDNPQDYRAYNALARFMADYGDRERAFTNLIKSLDLEVNQQEAYSILKTLYNGKWTDLIARADAAGSSKTVAMLKYYAYFSDQKYSQALSQYHDRLEGDQSNLKARALAAVIMRKQDSNREAESLVAALLKNTANQGVLMDIARYYITAGAGEKAVAVLEDIINSGQYTDLAEASQLLKELAAQSQGEKSYQLATRTLLFNSKPIIILVADLGDVLPSNISQAGKKLALNEDADWVTVAVPLNAQVWEYTGSTSYDRQNANLVLTAPVAWQEGRIWLKKPVKPPFKVSFEFLGGGGNGEMGQADGLVFMFNKDKNYTEEKGGSVGFGSSTGYGVEFDSFNLNNGRNENSWDPIGEPHIALLQNTYKTHLAYTPSSVSKDNRWHTARINVLQDQITVWVDEQQVMSWKGTWNVYYSALGFAAATGSGNNWHLLKNFSISTRTGVLNFTADELQIRTQQEEYLDSLPCAAHGVNFHINSWKHSQKTGPFEDMSGNRISRGIGIWSDNGYNSGVGYAEYDISTRRNCRFEADLGLEKRWNGSHGSTTFIIKADGKEVYSSVFKDNDASRHVNITLPADTKRLRLEVDQVRGSTGTHGAIWGNARIIQE
ncbi:MAG: tetratricopeptide repeat protein [Syntrophomonas sp.]